MERDAARMPPMELLDGVGVVTPRGDLDHREMVALKEALTHLMRLGITSVVLDLGDVTHVNYTSLGVLVERTGRLRTAGGDLRLAGPSDYLVQILRFAGVHHLFETFDSVDDAVDSYGLAEQVLDTVTAGSRARWVPRLQ